MRQGRRGEHESEQETGPAQRYGNLIKLIFFIQYTRDDGRIRFDDESSGDERIGLWFFKRHGRGAKDEAESDAGLALGPKRRTRDAP